MFCFPVGQKTNTCCIKNIFRSGFIFFRQKGNIITIKIHRFYMYQLKSTRLQLLFNAFFTEMPKVSWYVPGCSKLFIILCIKGFIIRNRNYKYSILMEFIFEKRKIFLQI